MSDTLSHQFIAALEPVRDRLYGIALGAEATGAKAEALLQKTARGVFGDFARSQRMDVAGAFEKALGGGLAAESPMPADVWARISAAIQVEAAGLAHSTAINPESVLLSPDPLLAPKKGAPAEEVEGFDLPGPSRFLIGAGVVIVIGVLLTVYILTRGGGSHAAATGPATQLSGGHGDG